MSKGKGRGGGRTLRINSGGMKRGRVKAGRTSVEWASANDQPNREMRRAVSRQARGFDAQNPKSQK